MRKNKWVGILILFVIIGGTVGFSIREIFLRQNTASVVDRCDKTTFKYTDKEMDIKLRVDDLLSRMTEQEKIGQMVLVEKNSIHDKTDIAKYAIGALLSGGGGSPKDKNPGSWLEMVNDFQDEAKKSCLSIPLLYGIDAVHGNANVLGATVFPHAIGLGASHDSELVKRVAQATADEMLATGINWNFAPNLDVAKDARWGKTYETFGADTGNNTILGKAYLQGLQGSVNDQFNVVGTLKHYVGGGVVEYGSSRNKDFKIEEGDIKVSEKVLRDGHIEVFHEAVKGGAKAVMISSSTWLGQPNITNRYLITSVLKEEFGFGGFVVSDWYGVYGTGQSRYEALVTAVNAGVDMVMTPYEYKDMIENIQTALLKGEISKSRLDDAVSRILKVKFEAGLFDKPTATSKTLSSVGSFEHQALAREAVRKSIVILDNKRRTLPLSKAVKTIVVGGDAADNIGMQSGGWTVEWQGVDGNVLPGMSILEGIKEAVSKSTSVSYSRSGDFNAVKAELGIAVVGEKPYAEGIGDREKLELSSEDLAVIEKVKQHSKKLVVVIVSGRPLDIKLYAGQWDAVVAAWLPGSQGGGVSDILFGGYPVTATLPLLWEVR